MDNQITKEHLWLAGLGAVALSRKEGSKLFEKLLQEGEAVSNQYGKTVEESVEQLVNLYKETMDELKGRFENIKDMVIDKEKLGEVKDKMIESVKIDSIKGAVNEQANKASQMAKDGMSKLEKVFNERVARSLDDLGVPSVESINALTSRIDELSAKIDELSKPAKPRTTRARKSAE